MNQAERIERSISETKTLRNSKSIIDKAYKIILKMTRGMIKYIDPDPYEDDIFKEIDFETIYIIGEIYKFSNYVRNNEKYENEEYVRRLQHKLSPRIFILSKDLSSIIKHGYSHFTQKFKGQNKLFTLSVLGVFEYYKSINEEPDDIHFIRTPQHYLDDLTLDLMCDNFFKYDNLPNNYNEIGNKLKTIASKHIKHPEIAKEEKRERAEKRMRFIAPAIKDVIDSFESEFDKRTNEIIEKDSKEDEEAIVFVKRCFRSLNKWISPYLKN